MQQNSFHVHVYAIYVDKTLDFLLPCYIMSISCKRSFQKILNS